VVVSGGRRAVFRLGAAAGIAGPAAFTGAWIASSLRQTRQGPGGLQLSGLAAPDARNPAIMLAGFLVAGGCTVAFGAALRAALCGTPTGGAGPGPALIVGAGLGTVAAGLLRRDHLLLDASGAPGASATPARKSDGLCATVARFPRIVKIASASPAAGTARSSRPVRRDAVITAPIVAPHRDSLRSQRVRKPALSSARPYVAPSRTATGGLTETEIRHRYAAALGLTWPQAGEFVADLWHFLMQGA